MKRFLLICIMTILFIGCGTKKSVTMERVQKNDSTVVSSDHYFRNLSIDSVFSGCNVKIDSIEILSFFTPQPSNTDGKPYIAYIDAEGADDCSGFSATKPRLVLTKTTIKGLSLSSEMVKKSNTNVYQSDSVRMMTSSKVDNNISQKSEKKNKSDITMLLLSLAFLLLVVLSIFLIIKKTW